MNLYDIGSIINIITLIIAYSICSTFAGWFKAYVAYLLGDDTAQEAGFLTLNPLEHADIIGLIFLILFGYGWGKYIPINLHNFSYPYRVLKQCIAYCADTIAHIILALFSLIILLYLFGYEILYLAVPMIYTGKIYLPAFTQAYPNVSSLAIVCAIILVTLIYMSIILAAVKFIVSVMDLVIMHFFPKVDHRGYVVFLISIILLLLLVYPIRNYILYGIEYVGCFFAHIGGLL